MDHETKIVLHEVENLREKRASHHHEFPPETPKNRQKNRKNVIGAPQKDKHGRTRFTLANFNAQITLLGP